MRSEGYGSCVSVPPRDNKITIHWLHFKKGDFRITAAFKSYGVKQVNKPIRKLAQAYLDRVRSLCVSCKHKKSQRRACIDSRMLSTTIPSPCQRATSASKGTQSPAHQLVLPRMRSSPRVCTLVLFISYSCFRRQRSMKKHAYSILAKRII